MADYQNMTPAELRQLLHERDEDIRILKKVSSTACRGLAIVSQGTNTMATIVLDDVFKTEIPVHTNPGLNEVHGVLPARRVLLLREVTGLTPLQFNRALATFQGEHPRYDPAVAPAPNARRLYPKRPRRHVVDSNKKCAVRTGRDSSRRMKKHLRHARTEIGGEARCDVPDYGVHESHKYLVSALVLEQSESRAEASSRFNGERNAPRHDPF